MAGPTNVKRVNFANPPADAQSRPAEAAKTYARADVRHARILGAFIGFIAGLAVMFGIIWLATNWASETTVDTFGKGVALGQATNE